MYYTTRIKSANGFLTQFVRSIVSAPLPTIVKEFLWFILWALECLKNFMKTTNEVKANFVRINHIIHSILYDKRKWNSVYKKCGVFFRNKKTKKKDSLWYLKIPSVQGTVHREFLFWILQFRFQYRRMIWLRY